MARITAAPVTSFLGASAALLSISFIVSAPRTWEELAAWGYVPGLEIWNGKLWSLWATAFLHGDFIHLLFNLYWLWFFGSHLEPFLGRLKFAGICIVGTFISSSAELAVSGDTGIGLSGLVYAFFGYAWLARHESETFGVLMSKRTINWMLGWLVICLVLTWTDTYPIANSAHFAGIAFGMSLGLTQRKHPLLASTCVAGLVCASITVLVWCPWQTQWLGNKASHALDAGETDVAASYVERMLSIDPEDSWALYWKQELERRSTAE